MYLTASHYNIYVSHYYLENNDPKSCHLSVKFACRIDKYRADERITMVIGVVLIYFVRSNDEDFCMMLL